MYKILSTTSPIQAQSFKLFGYDLTFTLRFNSVSNGWSYDLFDNNEEAFICQGFGLAVGAPSLISKTLPFVVMLLDESGFGVNSISRDEMSNRLNIYFVSKEEFHEAIRQTN
jgi:hypothetical protein